VNVEAQAGVRAGDVLAGKYRVERILGAGGMGVVVAAHHMQLDEKVALKFLLPEALLSPEAVSRFLREARAAVRVKGEHVARVSDVGQLENGSPYIVMEYLDGLDLATWIRDRGALPIAQAVDFVLQSCEAIADAHAVGIVHRDLKPANLFCVERTDGTLSIKVLDFGISKVTTPGSTGFDMTRTSALVGSPYYMSPEQLQSSKGVDGRTDIWSMGVILFELISGRVPFIAEMVTELAIKIATEPPPPVRTFRVEVAPALDAVITRCLEKDRTTRYQTVGDLAVALGPFGTRAGQASVERVVGTLKKAGISGPVTLDQPLPPIVLTAVMPGPGGAPMVPSGPMVSSAPNVPATSSSWGQSQSSPAGQGRGALVAGVLAALALVTGLAVVAILLLRKPSTAASAASPSAATTAAIVSASPSSALPSSSSASTDPSSSSAAGAPASSAPQPGASIATATHGTSPVPAPYAAGKGARPLPTPSATAAPATAKPSCDPPYYYSASGTRIFKQECL
jgi:serine/threonine protein kinase